MKYILLLLVAMPVISHAQQNTPASMTKETPLICKLTNKELQERKSTIIASLKSPILQKKNLPNGYAYKFKGSDTVIDQLADYIKTERQCCDFFDFSLTTKGNGTITWLNITGPKGAKQFITSELGL